MIKGQVAYANRFSFLTATYEDVTSINVGAGIWLVSGQVNFQGSGITATGFGGAVGQSAGASVADIAGGDNKADTTALPGADADLGVPIRPHVLNLSVATTLYLKAYSTFGAGTPQCYGTIEAIRIR